MSLGKVRDLNRELESRDEQVGELMAAQKIVKLEAEQQLTLVTTLRQRVVDCETRHSELEVTAGHARQQLSTLQQEYDDSQQQLLQLKAQMRLQHRPNMTISLFQILIYMHDNPISNYMVIVTL